MREIQDAECLRGMQIKEGLTPLGTIHHRTDVVSRLDAAPLDFDRGQFSKGGAVRQAGKIGERGRLYLLLPLSAGIHERLTHGQRARLGPLPMHKRYHGAIDTQH